MAENHSMFRKLSTPILATTASLAILLAIWTSQISGSVIEGDDEATLQMAINLVRSGTIALDDPLRPSMYREPVPVFVNAGSIAVIEAVWGRADPEQYFSGDRARLLKYQNLLWMLLLSVSVYASVLWLTASWPCALASMWVANIGVPLTMYDLSGLGIDTLQSEIPATALLVAGSALAANGFAQARAGRVALAGIALGLLALTKASFFYVFAGYVATLCIVGATRWRPALGRDDYLRSLLLIVCFSVVCAPWMYRNFLQFGTLSIADRGGGVLAIRATKDQMTDEEYRGSFYVWAPEPVQPVVGQLLGFGPEDLKRGGRLQRLNRSRTSEFYADDLKWERAGRPDKVISLYRKSRATHKRLKMELEASGQAGSVRSDAIIQARALQYIRDHPWRHLVLTVPFLWRGAWLAFPVLALTLGLATWRRQSELALIALPAFGMVMFYGLLSHFIPRYGVPAYAIVIVCGAALLCGFVRRPGTHS